MDGLKLDREAMAARDRLISAMDAQTSVAGLFSLYRDSAIPAGAPVVQYVETERAAFWMASAVLRLAVRRPELVERLLSEITEYGAAQLGQRLGG